MRIENFGLFGLLSIFPDSWLVSRQAVRGFFGAVVATLALIPVFTGALDRVRITPLNQIVWGFIGVVGTLGFFALWIGMLGFWVRLDSSTRAAKRVWFVVLLMGAGYGGCVYYFCVYRPQVIRKLSVR